MACNDSYSADRHRTFVTRRAAGNRALTTAGHGAWFGAFVDGALVTQMGLVSAGSGLARFQAVETHPDHRGRGLAGTLVHHVSGYGFRELGAHTLVMVADPGYHAIRVYRAVGFGDSASQLQAERAPDGDRVVTTSITSRRVPGARSRPAPPPGREARPRARRSAPRARAASASRAGADRAT